jgi:hypothetical protein
MLGFISSYNAYVFRGSNVVEGSDIDELRSWVDEYCKDHPQENFGSVVRLLVDEPRRKTPIEKGGSRSAASVASAGTRAPACRYAPSGLGED